MTLWSLLLPFKWIIIGVGEVFRGIYKLLRGAVFLLGSLFKYFIKGIIIVSKGLAKSVGRLLKLILYGLKAIALGLFKIVKFIVLNFFRGIGVILKGLFSGIKFVFQALGKSLKEARRKAKIRQEEKRKIRFAKKEKARVIAEERRKVILARKAEEKAKQEEKRKQIAIQKEEKRKLEIARKAEAKAKQEERRRQIAIQKEEKRKLKIARKAEAKTKQEEKRKQIAIQKEEKVRLAKQKIEQEKQQRYEDKEKKEKIRKLSQEEKEDRTKKRIEAFRNFPKNFKKNLSNWFINLSFVKDIKNRREMKRQALMIDFDSQDAQRSEKKIQYRYVAKNADGKMEKGTVASFSRLDVHSFLLAEGFEVYEIKPLKGLSLSIGPTTRRINTNELVFFLTQLSTYIKAGIPLVDSIKILEKQAKQGNSKTVYKAIIYDLTMGDSFSEALEKQGSSFPRLLINMIKSSELAGNLSETLDDMADYFTSISKTRKQMKSAMTYPTVILIFAIAVVVFILTFVIPSFIDMYKDAEAEVPALTLAVIGISDFLINNAIWLIVGVALGIMGLYFMYKNVKIFRLLVQWIMMHTPVFGKIIIYNEVAMFAKTFASLWNHNVFITSSMEILSKITSNEIYKMLIFDAITNVARGELVSNSFKDHWAFPVVAYEMLLTGERTGQPGPMMDKVADYYQEEHRNAINQVKAFIEPALIIVLAVVVGIILLSVIIPMFKIYGELDVNAVR